MKTKPTPPTESTVPASSVTATTPTGVGGTCGTGKKKEPSPELLRERKRRKKALAQIRALEALVKSHQETEKALQEQVELAEASTVRWVNRAEETRKKLEFLASCKVKQDGPERLLALNLTMHIDPRQLERGSYGHRLCVAEDVMAALREKMQDTAIKALVESPILLRASPAAMKHYQSRKHRWIQELMMKPEMTAVVYHLGGPEKLQELWDLIFEAIKDMAMSVPPGTEIQWVDSSLEKPWGRRPSDW